MSKHILLDVFDVTWHPVSGCLGLEAYMNSIGALSKHPTSMHLVLHQGKNSLYDVFRASMGCMWGLVVGERWLGLLLCGSADQGV
jgi:hypothetical protein